MAASPHPTRTLNGHIGSPVTPPSSSTLPRKYSTVPASSSERIDLLWHLARNANHELDRIPLSQKQIRFCRDALVLLTKKLNASGRGLRRVIDNEFDFLLSNKLQLNKLQSRTTVGRLESNLPRNRYIDVLPYDDTRVLLEEKAGGLTSSYINASYIVDSTLESLPKFIATQGPLPNTSADFWEMIVQQQCPVIVMLTGFVDENNKMVKCGYYFPAQLQQSQTYGRLRITNKLTVTTSKGVTKRLLEIEDLESGGSVSMPVLHLQLDWPDFGVPNSSVSVREMVRILYDVPSNFGPFVVHCSAGIGRTGTYCTIDHTLRRILEGDLSAVQMENTVRNFRLQRFGMVQTREQYAFCYNAVVAELQQLMSTNNDK